MGNENGTLMFVSTTDYESAKYTWNVICKDNILDKKNITVTIRVGKEKNIYEFDPHKVWPKMPTVDCGGSYTGKMLMDVIEKQNEWYFYDNNFNPIRKIQAVTPIKLYGVIIPTGIVGFEISCPESLLKMMNDQLICVYFPTIWKKPFLTIKSEIIAHENKNN